MLRAWRIVKSRHLADAFTGEGARLYGGRWNSPGTAVVYAAESRALAALELLVHLHASQILASYSIIPVDFAEQLVRTVDTADLPRNWRAYPSPAENRAIGDAWVAERRSVVLAVPSAVVEGDRIFLLNPAHPDFAQVTIGDAEPFAFDERVLKRG